MTDKFKDINKDHGENTVLYLDEKEDDNVITISTGLPTVDMVVGNGGLLSGCMVELYGPESSGKTTLATYIMIEAQKMGYETAFVDMEYAYDKKLAKVYGLDFNKTIYAQPESAEQALDITERLIRKPEEERPKVIVIDSVDALVPRSVLEGNYGDSNMGSHAKFMSQATRKLTSLTARNNILLIWINQIRQKIGVMFGKPDTTPGGNALKFYSSYRLEVRRREYIKDNGKITGALTRVKTDKNKKDRPFKETFFTLMYGKGIDYELELVNIALELEILKKKGSWIKLDNETIGQGPHGVADKMREDKQLYETIHNKIKQAKED